MDALAVLFERRLEKIAMLQDFVAIFGRKAALLDGLRDADLLTAENRELLAQCRFHCHNFRTVLLPAYKEQLAEGERLQSSMLNMIEALDLQQEQELERGRTAAPGGGAGGGHLLQVPAIHPANASANKTPTNQPKTPTNQRLLLSDYKNSPFARSMRPAALQFIDFEASLEAADFGRVPQYMRGRETLADLQQFLETIVVRCFTDKYQLLMKSRDCVRNPQQLTLWKHYRQQAEYFPHRMFITQGDLATLMGRMVDKKTSNRLAMLRHLQLLQEQRHQSTVCYLWLGGGGQ